MKKKTNSSSKFMPITVVDVQNLSWNTKKIIHYFRSLGY